MKKSFEPEDTRIDEKTLLPISFVIVIAVAVSSLAHTTYKALANEEEIKEVKVKVDTTTEALNEVKLSLARIEGHLGIKTPQNQETPKK